MPGVKMESRVMTFVGVVFWLGLLIAAGGSAQQPAEQPSAAGVTVYEGARLIAGDGNAPIEDAAFVVEDNRFTAVGQKGHLDVPAGAARVDLTGKTVMPAIVDSHKH